MSFPSVGIPVFLAASSGATLGGLDWLAILAYFGVLAAVGAWVVRKGKDTTADYFLLRLLQKFTIGRPLCVCASVKGRNDLFDLFDRPLRRTPRPTS